MSASLPRRILWESWDLEEEADRRFRRIVFAVGIPALLLAILITLIELQGATRGGGTFDGARYVELLPEKQAEVAPKEEEPKPAPKNEPKTQQAAPKAPPRPIEKPVEKPQPNPIETAREVASKSGVMQFTDQLADLRDKNLTINSNQPLASSSLSSRGGIGSGGSAESLASSAAAGSGGIGGVGSASVTSSQSGSGLGTRRTGTVASPVGFGRDLSRPGLNGNKLAAGRTLEEIQLTFDRNKSAYYAIFNRAARENPSIGAGKIVVSLTIAPSGAVTDCHLVSSSFNDPDLERRVIERVKLMNFGAKDVPPFTYPNYPINYIPS